MKTKFKLFLTLCLMTTFAFTQYPNCAHWGYWAASQEESYYGTMDLRAFNDAVGWYQSACEAAGGSQYMVDPVFM